MADRDLEEFEKKYQIEERPLPVIRPYLEPIIVGRGEGGVWHPINPTKVYNTDVVEAQNELDKLIKPQSSGLKGKDLLCWAKSLFDGGVISYAELCMWARRAFPTCGSSP